MAKAATQQRRGTRRVPRAAREQQMLDVAERMFAERGYEGTSMNDIAAGVGVSHTMLFAYFGSKEGLFVACTERARGRLEQRLSKAFDEAEGAADQIDALSRAFFNHVEIERELWRVLMTEAERNTTVAAGLQGVRGQNARLVADFLRRSGVPDEDPRKLDLVAHMLEAAAFAAGTWWLDNPEIPRAWMEERFSLTQRQLIASVSQ